MPSEIALLDERAVLDRMLLTSDALWSRIYRGRFPRPIRAGDTLRWHVEQVELAASLDGLPARPEAGA